MEGMQEVTFSPEAEKLAIKLAAFSIMEKLCDEGKITEDELKYLEINVDVLSNPQPIESQNQLDPKKYGVIVTSGYKKGLLLPDLEGVDTIEEQIAIAKNKAGILKDEEISLERFTVTRHK